MKIVDIIEIRRLTAEIIAVADSDAPDSNYDFSRILELGNQIFNILPCEICNGTGRVPSLYGLTQMHGTPKELITSTKPCPDCS